MLMKLQNKHVFAADNTCLLEALLQMKLGIAEVGRLSSREYDRKLIVD